MDKITLRQIDFPNKEYSELQNNINQTENMSKLIILIFLKNYKKYIKKKERNKLYDWGRKKDYT